MRTKGKAQLDPLRRFLVQQEWPQRIATFDQYGGAGMAVELRPVPSPEQLHRLRAEFGDAYDFTEVGAHVHDRSQRG